MPIIESMITDESRRLPAVNVMNHAAYISNLPTDVVVEVPAVVDREGVHAQQVGPLPEAIAALLQPQYAIHRLLTEAWRSRSRALLLQCLLLDPLVASIAAAEEMLTTMLELQDAFLGSYE